jgi:uncharacterized coiled-coil protein SlyX
MDEALEMLAVILAEVDDMSHATRESLTSLMAHLRALGGEFDDSREKSLAAPAYWLN